MIMARITKTRLSAWLFLLVMLWAKPSRAQDINYARVIPGSDRIQLTMGLDPAVLSSVGFVQAFAVGSRTAMWELDLGMVLAETDAKDLRARVGLQTTLWQAGVWRIAAAGRLIARSTSNSIYDGAGFGVDLGTCAGYYRHGWFVAGLIGYDRTLVMHLEHSDWYRDNIYADAVDGWYRGESGILHGGIAAGVAVAGVELAGRVELRRLDGGESLDPPVVGVLSITVPF